MKKGWYEIPRATTIEEASKYIINDSINKVLDSCLKEDHLWTLIKYSNLTVINCYVIDEDGLEGFCYHPCTDEDYPEYLDVPIEWLSKISTIEERKKEFNQDYSDLEQWIQDVKDEYEEEKNEEQEEEMDK